MQTVFRAIDMKTGSRAQTYNYFTEAVTTITYSVNVTMDVKIVEKQSFAVIGKLGHGYSNESFKRIPPLWKEANSKFN